MAKTTRVAVSASVDLDESYRATMPIPNYYDEGSEHLEVYLTLLDVIQADGSVLVESDFMSVTLVVDCLLSYEKAIKESEGVPYTVTNSRGDAVKHPIHTLVRQTRADLQSALRDAGLGPKARLYVTKSTAITVLGA